MLGDSFAQALRDGRALFNKRVAEGQRRFPGFDTAALSAFVAGCADPVVEAAGRVAPGRVPSAAQAVFDLAIEVTGHGMTQDALVQRVWTDLAPQCGAVLASQP
ncbi:MAG: hypothetical protein ACLGI6_21950, partial [Gammaproteobacteria bacterium]